VKEREATVQYFISYAIKAESHLQWLIYHTDVQYFSQVYTNGCSFTPSIHHQHSPNPPSIRHVTLRLVWTWLLWSECLLW